MKGNGKYPDSLTGFAKATKAAAAKTATYCFNNMTRFGLGMLRSVKVRVDADNLSLFIVDSSRFLSCAETSIRAVIMRLRFKVAMEEVFPAILLARKRVDWETIRQSALLYHRAATLSYHP